MATSPKRTVNRKINRVISGILAAGIFLDLLIMGCQVSDAQGSVWETASLWIESASNTSALCFALILLFCINTAAAAAGIYFAAFKKKLSLYPLAAGLCTHVVMLAISKAFDLLTGIGAMLMILHLLLMTVGLFICMAGIMRNSSKQKRLAKKVPENWRGRALLALSIVSMLLALSLFYVPFYSYTLEGEDFSLVPLGVLFSGSSNRTCLLVFSILFIFCTVSFVYFLNSFSSYSVSETAFADRVQTVIGINAFITGAYFAAGVAFCSIKNVSGGLYTTNSYVPFLLMIAVSMVWAFCVRGIDRGAQGMRASVASGARMECFIYGALASVLTVISALTDIIRVTFTRPETLEALRLNGYKLLTSYNDLGAGFQLVTFFLIAILSVTVGLFIASLAALISRSRLFYKITLAELLCGAVFSLMIGLFGKYYEIVQKINEDAILSWIGRTVNIDQIDIAYKVKSQSFYWFCAVMAIVMAALIRKPYTRGTVSEAVIAAGETLPISDGPRNTYKPAADRLPAERNADSVKTEEDPCPAFTELDRKIGQFLSWQEKASASSFEALTLPELVQFVVNYAKDSRLHLSYTPQDIAAFIAGLGATRLTILQGMSGTGKTSLPKIFTEAIMGKCEIIEVESSWRDKNELLGYYNEFSRTYTPKKFTQALYKAKLNPDRLTFIVLDEMNLSRIEYYFSDFLSLMENEEDKREIKLLNVGLYRTENGKPCAYLGLTEGHTLQIPANVWFIGTANRDESTFEISDKVYDRAHTMNFNKRAPKALYRSESVMQRYLSVKTFRRMLEEAERTVPFDLDTCAVIKEVEAILEPYNISFGNRVANQIETFVRIYTACFLPSEAVMNEAIETILLSKVVSKLEFKSVENKAQLAAEFRRLKLYRCSDFILKLNED